MLIMKRIIILEPLFTRMESKLERCFDTMRILTLLKLTLTSNFKDFVNGICVSVGCRYLCKKNEKNNGFFNG